MDLPRLDIKSSNITPLIFQTASGTPYLKSPGFSILAVPSFTPDAMRGFLEGFDVDWDVDDYLNDQHDENGAIPDGANLAMTAGQLCYMSFGAARTRRKDAKSYFDKTVRIGGHGSIIEHCNYTVLFWGVDRAFTHELVRHRAGMAYSQLSQRYVSGKLLRFVERAEFQDDVALHDEFERRIDVARKEYDYLAQELRRTINVEGLSKTEARKAVNQAARNCLPNETEAPILATGNARSWRHIIHMRASKHADTPIRRAIYQLGCALIDLEPHIFGDFQKDPEHFTLTSQYA
jgi:thymidylate synthase (FAD)